VATIKEINATLDKRCVYPNVGTHVNTMTDQTSKYKLQPLDITPEWIIKRNEFYNISPIDNVPEEDKFDNIYCQEDLLLLQKGNYHLDLGWYGLDSLDNNMTGYCIHLFKGDSWLNNELLVKIRTKDKNEIVDKIHKLIKAVDNDEFSGLRGYQITDDNTSNLSDFEEFDIRNK
jgi:hypothetical protein